MKAWLPGRTPRDRVRPSARALDAAGPARRRDDDLLHDARDRRRPLRHGPLLGLANTQQGKWTKYGDPQPESISENLHRRYGLDLPWYEQYGNYLAGVAMFDFGPSLSFRNVTVHEIQIGRASCRDSA